jgi:GTPase SAR1 family protein
MCKNDEITSVLIIFTLRSAGIDFRVRMLQMDNKTVKLQIWDTGGQERFKYVSSAIPSFGNSPRLSWNRSVFL